MADNEYARNKRLNSSGCNIYDWEEFKREQAAYMEQGFKAMEKIDAIHQWGSYLQSIEGNTSFLSKLDPISSAIKLFCWLVGGTIVLTALAIGAKIMMTPTSISTGDHTEMHQEHGNGQN